MNTKNEKSGANQDLLDGFRAYLQTVITATQFRVRGRLAALPGPKTPDYCRALAKVPDNTLAAELSAPVNAILDQIDRTAMEFYRPLYQKLIKDPAEQAEYERVLWQIDFAIALILRRLPHLARWRAKRTKCEDLLCEVTCKMTDCGPDAVSLIRRYRELDPKQFVGDEETSDTDLIGDFVWDTYLRVEALERLADEFPTSVRVAARGMHGWPMLAFRHTTNRRRFQELATRLELGVHYPLDASEAARFKPYTPLVLYLDELVFKVDYVRRVTAINEYESPEAEFKNLRSWWSEGMDEYPTDEVVEALRAVPKLPPLTKATAIEWAEKAIVPVIMATDARDWKNCEEPALRRIANQAGVKSRATFKSRLLSAVSSALGRLARG